MANVYSERVALIGTHIQTAFAILAECETLFVTLAHQHHKRGQRGAFHAPVTQQIGAQDPRITKCKTFFL